MKNVDPRLSRLEERLTPAGCEVCRDWIGAVLCGEDGECNRPECCPNFGREVPYTQIVQLEGVSLDAI